MKIIAADRSKNIVVFGEIDIFFSEGVGTLLTNIKAMKIVRYGVINLKLKSKSKLL